LVTFCAEIAFYNRLLKIKGGIEVKGRQEEDVGTYRMTLRKGDNTLI
jgi:hypothetical protein